MAALAALVKATEIAALFLLVIARTSFLFAGFDRR
jgi:hypothetical protein